MHEFTIAGILLDIEGTVAPVSFVYDVMFPYVRENVDSYLQTHWGKPALIETCDVIARDAGHPSLAAWGDERGIKTDNELLRLVADEVRRLMDGDVKATGLKRLQGEIWESGFNAGLLIAQLFEEVPDKLREWNAAGFDVRIYSSGSIHAQRLFFGHSTAGDLQPLLKGYYDTTSGPKKESGSYTRIAADFPLEASNILFFSDVVAELDAASAAGMRTSLCLRPGNATVAANHGHAEIKDFNELRLQRDEL